MDQWGALTTNASVVMTRDDLSIRRKTVIVSLVFNQLKFIEYVIAVLNKTFFHVLATHTVIPFIIHQ